MDNIEQVRLNIGDTDTEEYFLDDTVISFLLQENGNNVLETSIVALEAIINNIALQPERWRIGDAAESRASVDQLEDRLKSLINKRNAKAYTAIPIILHPSRKNWDDIDKVFN
ncbi:hypothetical protein [Vreelandella arcis]|uniref:Uncharacterized protein n=1 Tax=Vreelandella arcis TaxID=416873 RepID=A0A1H0IZG6_9GAMM|nr:hypothetical protein [Halomonas arcis]SDO36874.1 hypothetical protein SAMN04487951_1235 [Halomonas arcis]